MNIYHYDEETGEYIGESGAGFDPIDGLLMLPANATTAKPPTAGANQAARKTPAGWEVVEDHRGFSGYDENNNLVVIGELNKPINPLWKTEKPAAVQAAEDLAISDQSVGRVVDDLVDLLIDKGLITMAELPAGAQTKLNDRAVARGKL